MKVMPYGKDDGENPLQTRSINICISSDYTDPDQQNRSNGVNGACHDTGRHPTGHRPRA
jgi:hypothetical protein